MTLVQQIRIGIVILFYVSLAYPVAVGLFWPWWQEWFGRSTVSLRVSLAIVSFPTWLNVTFGLSIRTSELWAWVLLVGIWYVIISMIVSAAVVYQEQRRAVRRKHVREGTENASARHQRISTEREPPGD